MGKGGPPKGDKAYKDHNKQGQVVPRQSKTRSANTIMKTKPQANR